MALPEVEIEIEDGALGIIPDTPANVQVKLGISPGGNVQQLYSFSTPTAARAVLKQGKLLESVAATLDVAGGPVLVMPLNPSVNGSVSAVTHTGPGAGTVVPSLAPAETIIITITLGGALGVGMFTHKVGTAATSQPILLAAGPFLVPGTLTKLSFAAGVYVLAETYTFNVNGSVVQSGGGPVISAVSSPLDDYSVIVEIMFAGGLGTATFRYTLDGGDNYSDVITVPGGGIYAIPNTGVVLTFAGVFTLGDLYAFITTAAGFSNTDVTNALVALRLNPAEWGSFHIVGTPTSAANAASLAVVVDAQLVAAEAEFRFAFGIVECPTTETDSAVAAAFTSFSSLRTMVCAGDIEHVSTINGRAIRRNCAWVVSSRVALVPIGESLARVRRGPVTQVLSLYRDEAITEFLHAQRFTTMRTFRGRAGFFITMGNMMAPFGSDFSRVQYRRVMDEACRITRLAELPFLNDDVRVDPSTGFIDERDAAAFEATVNAQLFTALVAAGQVSASSVQVDRSVNLLSTSEQPVEVRITPKAYLETIRTKIGFRNPALAPTV